MPVKPSRTIRDVPVIGSFFRGGGPAYSTSQQTELYDILKESEQTYRTISAFKREGKIDEALAIAKENKASLQVRKRLSKASRELSKLRKKMDIIYRDTKMTAATKRKKIDVLLQRRNDLAQRAVTWADMIFEKE